MDTLRGKRGEAHWAARLTFVQVEKIRTDPRPPKTIAFQHGVSAATVRDILNGRTWREGK